MKKVLIVLVCVTAGAAFGIGELRGKEAVDLRNAEAGVLPADSVGADEIADDAIVKGNLAAGDFGDFTAGADGTCSIDQDAVDIADIIDARTDTNDTIDVTIYTPYRIGDIIIGSASNTVHIAIGATSNDWLQINP